MMKMMVGDDGLRPSSALSFCVVAWDSELF